MIWAAPEAGQADDAGPRTGAENDLLARPAVAALILVYPTKVQ